ncbi:MAG TPA: Type 1 glutamine amidotransferase-like domain-containing protein [Chloroflexota bacterium]
MDGSDRAGPIALVGSGEYLPQMEEVDRVLLEHVGGRSARVVVLPTAAGLETPASPRRWAQAGVGHFTRLGARAEAANILVRDDAFDQRWLALLQSADFIYFSGGSPRHVIETFVDSPAWEVIRARHAAGAVLAGCSAGAMAFGRFTLQPRRLWSTEPDDGVPPADTWYPALGLVPNLVVLPHFDRWIARMGPTTLTHLAGSLAQDLTLIGVDEDTALVRFDASSAWQVMGRQSVSIIDAERGRLPYAAGTTVDVSC